jgi:hypothetical protein
MAGVVEKAKKSSWMIMTMLPGVEDAGEAEGGGQYMNVGG